MRRTRKQPTLGTERSNRRRSLFHRFDVILIFLTFVLRRTLGEYDFGIEAALVSDELTLEYHQSLILKGVREYGISRVLDRQGVLAIRNIELWAMAVGVPLNRALDDCAAAQLDPSVRIGLLGLLQQHRQGHMPGSRLFNAADKKKYQTGHDDEGSGYEAILFN